ncbi:MAG: hypothetical protein ABSB82_09715 [Terriglobia bacterium]|jgi:hypothetical protein
MFVASLILILSTAVFLFYFQATCQTILRRKFDREYFQSIVNANRLEFPWVLKFLEDSDGPVDFTRVRQSLECDFLALTYLLKHSAGHQQRYSWDVRLLMLYFRLVHFFMVVRHALRLREERALVNLTSILQYMANVVGQRVNDRFANPVPAKSLTYPWSDQ